MDQDARISRLTRALPRAESEECFVTICVQIQELLDVGDNRRYVARSFNSLLPPLDATFKMLTSVKWPDGVQQYAKLLSKIANSLESSGVKFFQWIFESMDRENPDIRSGDMIAVVQEVFFKMIPLLSPKACHTLLNDIHEVMNKERFQSADTFKALCSAFIKVLEQGATCKTVAFQELVDVIVGWMVDEEQSENNTYLFCAEMLLKLETHFVYDPNFTSQLLVLILEDFEEAILEVQTNNDLKQLARIILLVKAYSTITSIPCEFDKGYIVASSDRFMENVNKVLSISHMTETDDYFIFKTKKKIICHTMEYLSESDHADRAPARMFIKELLQVGLDNIEHNRIAFPMLRDLSPGLNSWIQSVSSNSTLDDESSGMINMVLKFLDNEFIHISDDDPLHMVCCVHSFLKSRNVVILQKVYTWLIEKCQLSSEEPFITSDKKVISIVLLCLSDIASSKSNSILTRWALDPSIFDLLMGTFKHCNDEAIQLTILSILKAHCLAHSHFVSSVFSQSFSTDSPGASHNCLQTLMDFWISIMQRKALNLIRVVSDWIALFLKTSSSYSKSLAEGYEDFYRKLFQFHWNKAEWYFEYAKILLAVVTEPAYADTIVYTLAKEATITLMLRAKDLNRETRLQIRKIMTKLNEVVVLEPSLESIVTSPNDPPTYRGLNSTLCSQIDSSEVLLTNSEFEEFMSNLLRIEAEGCQEVPHYSKKVIADAVDILIRGKLKSFLGKPPDLFSQLQALFKKYRLLKYESVPVWKFEFVHCLDLEINLAMQESLLSHPNLSDALKHFYTTNRVPCTEWLKRLRSDVSEVALQTGNSELGFLYSSMAQDETRVKRAAFRLKDPDTLYAMHEVALSFYIKGKFEETLKLVEKFSDRGEGSSESVQGAIAGVSEILTKMATKSLADWPEKDVMLHGTKDLRLQEPSVPVAVLEKQVDVLSNVIYSSGLSKKTSLLAVGKKESVFDIHTVLKLVDLVRNEPSISSELREEVTILQMNKLIDLGNVNLVRSIVTKEGLIPSIDSTTISDFNLHMLKLQADIHFKDEDIEKSASIYSTISSLLENSSVDCKNFRSKFVIDFTKKLNQSEQFVVAILQSLQLNASPEEQYLFVQDEYTKHLRNIPEDKNCWYNFGNYLYSSAKKLGIEDTESQAVECFSQYLSLCEKPSLVTPPYKRKSSKVITSMIKLLKLHKRGFKMDSERVFTNGEWLTLLPSLAQIDEFHAPLFKRFPQQVGFHLASHQAAQKEYFKPCVKDRKALFDTDSYGFFEYSDDIRAKSLDSYRTTEDSTKTLLQSYEPSLQLPEEITIIFRELQRIGSSREDQWIYAFQKLHMDWHKRITSLKDDLTRDCSPELFRSYTLPVTIYLEELLKLSQACESPADVMFLVRHKTAITKIITQFRQSQSLEGLLGAYSDLGRLINLFNATPEPKVSVSFISPILAKFDFQNSGLKLTLPGIHENVSITKVDSHAQILATKTRPKRLTFRGSDGKYYSYLVKGNENLNVDTGVMQFMNLMEHLTQWPSRSYSVTPLGKKGGLIQLVTNTTPLFHLYKKFLQKNGIEERTTDLFWSRMNNLGFSDRSNQAALKQVFDQLLKETPPDILSKELLLSARNPKAWYNCVHTITTDCAIGSAIGYVLGIGDRHLDNILIDLKAGYFIHVDFSLVFGKGATLRVPEKVPFRLTQNICSALKYPGHTGSFKMLLEKFILCMQDFKEIVMFGVRNIAEAHGIGEDLPVNPLPILKAELNSAAFILKSRQNNIIRPGSILKADLLDMCKELNVTKKETTILQEGLSNYTKDIEDLTVALGILNDRKGDAGKLSALREKCDFITKRQNCIRGITTFRKKLQEGFSNLSEALALREELIIQTDKNSELLHQLKLSVSNFPRNKAWFDTVQLFQEAIELADIALTFSWVSLRHPITCHAITRVLEALEYTSESSLSVQPLTGCHTETTATAVWMLLFSDLTKIQDQIEKLKCLLVSQGITDIEGQIKETEAQCTSTEETLSRFTLLSPNSSRTSSDMDVFLKFALPNLECALNEPNILYGFIVKILLLVQNASKFAVPFVTYEVLESIINLHVKARDDLSAFLDGHFDALLNDGFKVITVVSTVLKALAVDLTDFQFTREVLTEQWKQAVQKLQTNFQNFKGWLTGQNTANFDVTSDVVTSLLSPISSFTLPLTQEVQRAIVRTGRKLLAAFPNYASVPRMDDPLAVLIAELKSMETRLKFLKDLRHSLDGCESAALFLAAEKDRFEWAFHHFLHKQNLAVEKRWDGLNTMVGLLESFSNKWLQCDENMDGSKMHDPSDPKLAEIYTYMRSVHTFVTAVVTFETNRFNNMFVLKYLEFQKQIENLRSQEPLVLSSPEELGGAEKFIAECSEAMNSKIQARSASGDRNWANMVEKLLTSQLQTEIQKKKVAVESMAKAGKSDKLIATRMARIVNRWRRVLANLHPTLMFIYKYAKPTPTINIYNMTIEHDWFPRVAQFWLFQAEEEQLADPDVLHENFDFSEKTLRVLLDILEDARPIQINDDLVGPYSTAPTTTPSLIKFCEEKIDNFNRTSSVDRLIMEATRPETLSKMYEGWSAWV